MLSRTVYMTFTPKGPNVGTNHMPVHRGASASVIEDANQELVEKVKEIQTYIDVIGVQLKERGLIPTNHGDKDVGNLGTNTDESL